MKDLFPWTFGPKLWVHTIHQNALYMGVHDTRQNTVSGEPFLSLRQTQILPCLSTRLTCGDLWPPKFKETLSFSVVKDPWFTNLSSLWRDSRTLLRPPNPYEKSMTSPPCGLPFMFVSSAVASKCPSLQTKTWHKARKWDYCGTIQKQ